MLGFVATIAHAHAHVLGRFDDFAGAFVIEDLQRGRSISILSGETRVLRLHFIPLWMRVAQSKDA